MYHKRDKKCNLTSFNYEFIPVQQQKGEMGAELDLLQLEVPKAFIQLLSNLRTALEQLRVAIDLLSQARRVEIKVLPSESWRPTSVFY